MNKGSLGLQVVVVLMAATTTACTPWAQADGPLNLGEEPIEWCTRGGEGTSHTLGDRALAHEGDTPVTITAVSLVEPEGVRLLDAVLVPIVTVNNESTLIGSRHGWPPGGDEDEIGMPHTWDERRDAVGAVVQPGEIWNFAVGLESQEESSRAAGIKVEYRGARGQKYVAQGLTEINIKRRCP